MWWSLQILYFKEAGYLEKLVDLLWPSLIYFRLIPLLNIAIVFSPENSMCTNNSDTFFRHKLWYVLLNLKWRRYESRRLFKFAVCHSWANYRLSLAKPLNVSTERLNDLHAQPSHFTHSFHSFNKYNWYLLCNRDCAKHRGYHAESKQISSC